MKRRKLRLSCLLLLVGAVNANAQDTRFPSYDDDAVFVGDTADTGTYVGDSYVGSGSSVRGETVGWSETAPAAGGSHHLPGSHSAHRSQHATQGHYHAPSSYASSEYCGEIGSVLHGCNPKWLRAETLLWFPKGRDGSPLVSANTATGDPLQTVFGNDIGEGLAPGFRLDFGHYFAGGQYGLGARVWGLYDASDDFSASSDGTRDLARPFFNTNPVFGPPRDDFAIIGGVLGGETFTGSVNAESELDMIATEAYGRMMLGQGAGFHVDLLGGYSYFGIDDTLTINSSTTNVTTDPGLVRTFRDSYETENHFHGGQIGLETILKQGRWSLLTLTKVHLGNVRQQVNIDGSSTRQVAAPVPLETFDNGFLVQGQQGQYERDQFTFVPELNLKLAYMLRRNISLSVGYSFLYWDDLALASDQIDNRVDGALLLTDDPNPVQEDFTIRDSGFWIQGIDLGVTIDF
ncbi:BBP7 family outer membrane beta-barrel protein [Candidatus Laterigemmans baculatus]|uniref:BBP7 family outer membrane beta-barrel protein n=1 Tax=Candidatus Laterigemmans baculatus TaxID=2770505 RepID=UPI0013DCFB4A|nr:BBP7 family outer membrane beta-barrel protein [Candidatus Laterigemmans baculatus]